MGHKKKAKGSVKTGGRVLKNEAVHGREGSQGPSRVLNDCVLCRWV